MSCVRHLSDSQTPRQLNHLARIDVDFTRFEVILDMRLAAMNEMLEFTRRELLAEIKFEDKEDKAA